MTDTKVSSMLSSNLFNIIRSHGDRIQNAVAAKELAEATLANIDRESMKLLCEFGIFVGTIVLRKTGAVRPIYDSYEFGQGSLTLFWDNEDDYPPVTVSSDELAEEIYAQPPVLSRLFAQPNELVQVPVVI